MKIVPETEYPLLLPYYKIYYSNSPGISTGIIAVSGRVMQNRNYSLVYGKAFAHGI